MKWYTGVGSRSTPSEVLLLIGTVATNLRHLGFMSRSGGAAGADTAFGAVDELWLPWRGFRGHRNGLLPTPGHFEVASLLHPRWRSLDPPVRSLHARNVGQVLGMTGLSSRFVVCWTPDGAQEAREVSSKTGGTGTAIKLASICGIPVFNLQREGALQNLLGHVNANEQA